MMKRIAFCLTSFLFFQTVFGQQAADTTELLPVEVRAVRASATAPFAKTNLSRTDIEKLNLGADLPFLLNQTPSVVVNSDAGNGVGYTGIRIRGTDATRINVTLNGIPYNDAESQGTFFVDLPDFASSVNSIQIQRGVGTSTNGAGSFGGTINFSTNEANRQSYLEVNNAFGSFQTVKNTLKAGTGLLNNHFTVDLRLSHVASDGYIERADSRLRSFYFSTAYLSKKNDLRLNIFSGNEKTYQAWNGVSESDLKTHRRINYAGMERSGRPYENETDNYRQDHYQLFYTHRFSNNVSFNTAVFLTNGNGYYEQYKADEAYSDYGLPNNTSGSNTITNTDVIRQLWLHNHFYGNIFSLERKTSHATYTFGGSYTRYDGNHFGKLIWADKGITGNPKWYDLNALKTDGNVYAKMQHRLSTHLEGFLDLQLRRVSHQIHGFRNNPTLNVEKTYGFFNPKAGLTYSNDGWTVYGSYSIARKEPNRDDFEAAGNQLPRPETLRDAELGFERHSRSWTFAMNLFHMDYKDQLVLTGKINDVGAYTRTNIPDSYRMGAELQASVKPVSWLTAAANFTLSRNRIRNYSDYIDDYDNGGQKTNFYPSTSIAFSPDRIASASLTVTPIRKMEVAMIGKWVGRQFLDNTGNISRSLDPYYTQDLRLSYSVTKKWVKNASLIFQLNNVFNKLYEPNGYTFSYYYNNTLTTENYYFPMAGRNWMVGLNIRL